MEVDEGEKEEDEKEVERRPEQKLRLPPALIHVQIHTSRNLTGPMG